MGEFLKGILLKWLDADGDGKIEADEVIAGLIYLLTWLLERLRGVDDELADELSAMRGEIASAIGVGDVDLKGAIGEAMKEAGRETIAGMGAKLRQLAKRG